MSHFCSLHGRGNAAPSSIRKLAERFRGSNHIANSVIPGAPEGATGNPVRRKTRRIGTAAAVLGPRVEASPRPRMTIWASNWNQGITRLVGHHFAFQTRIPAVLGSIRKLHS